MLILLSNQGFVVPTRMDSLEIVRLWAAAAWADNELHPREAAALRRLIDSSDDLDAEALSEANSYLRSRPELQLDKVNELSVPARQGAYRAAQQLIAIDGKLTDDELAFLAKLRRTLDLDEETLRRIESES